MHFIMGVILRDPEELDDLMAPYQENNMGSCPEEFLEFIDATEGYDEYYEDNKDGIFKGMTMTEAAKAEGYTVKKEDGKITIGYMINPNAEWDWYQIGGRWSNMLLVDKDKVEEDLQGLSWEPEVYEGNLISVNAAKLKDIRWDKIKMDRQEHFSKSWDEFHALPEKEKDSFKKMYVYGIRNDETKEEFIERQSEITVENMLTADDGWDTEYGLSWYKDIDCLQDHYLIMVDCHI